MFPTFTRNESINVDNKKSIFEQMQSAINRTKAWWIKILNKKNLYKNYIKFIYDTKNHKVV